METGWRHFTAEHPWVTEDAASCRERLARALGPLLEAAERPGEDGYSRWARWLRPLVDSTRAMAADHPETALGHLCEAGRDGLTAAVVIVREIVGRERIRPEDALAAVLTDGNSWRYWRENPDACRRALDELR